jgi:hypothetical protein
MKAQTYIKGFSNKVKAFEFCVMKNTTSKKELFAVVDGWDENNSFAVVDLMTAIELEQGYTVATSILHGF